MALNPGDILFVGWDADNEDVSFITTVDLAAGEVIYFTDNEWDGTQFSSGEQVIEWTVPAGGISAGTVVTIDMDPGAQTATIDSGGTLDYITGDFDLAQANEMFWAYQGTRTGDTVTVTNFVAVIGQELNGSNAQTPNLTNTGLTTSNGALIIEGDNDYMEWTGDATIGSPVSTSALIASIMDPTTWIVADSNQTDNPSGSGFTIDPINILCFVRGTRIRTPHGGDVAVETLQPGMRVDTLRNGGKRVAWIGRSRVSRAELKKNPKLLPVRITAGALGQGLPARDLLVSRQHRMLVSSKIAERMFGARDVLVAAIRLTELPGIYVDDTVDSVEYFHILFDEHQVIFADDAPSESLFTGPEALRVVSPEAREEIVTLFPELDDPEFAPPPALPIPSRQQQKRFVARHLSNRKPLLGCPQPGHVAALSAEPDGIPGPAKGVWIYHRAGRGAEHHRA